jgi:hypothetical protein
LAAAHIVSADDISWQGGVGDWFSVSNWLDQNNGLNQVPGSSDNAYIDNGGTAQISYGSGAADNLNVDFGSGCVLSGIGSLSVGGTGYVGYSGTGTFTQSGGTASFSGSDSNGNSLSVGDQTGSQGVYNLSSGNLNAAANETVGNNGSGTFIQTGGTNTVSDYLDLGYYSGSAGAYTLGTGAALLSFYERVGVSGNGTFNQTGGTNAVAASLFVGYSGTGTYTLSGTGSLSVNGGGYFAGAGYIGYSGTGSFTQSGGTALFSDSDSNGNSLSIGDQAGGRGVYILSAGNLTTGKNETVGNSGSGTFIQTGGTNNVGRNSGLYLGVEPGSTGSYALSAGTLESSAEYIGVLGSGTFNQTGWTNTTGSLYLGYTYGSTGVYSLSGTAVLTSSYEYIGCHLYYGSGGTGTFIQSGGSNYAGVLNLGVAPASSGSYTLSAGALYARGEGIGGPGSGTFNQTGGTNTISGSLDVGYTFGSTGVYSLGGTGTLACGNEYIGGGGTGTFIQSGGSNNNNNGTLEVGDGPGSSGIYDLSGGAITSSAEIISDDSGAGTFIQSGGMNTAGTLYIGTTSIYSLSGTGSLTVTGSVYVGGSGTLSVSGGQMTVAGLLEVDSGSLSVTGGTVSAGNTVNFATITVTGSTANLGAVTGTGTLNVGEAASVTASGLQQSSITINPTGLLTLKGGTASSVNSLNIIGSGQLDITNTQLFINYGNGPDPITSIAAYISSGYNGGAWNGLVYLSTIKRT